MIYPQYQLRLNRDDSWHMKRPHFHEDIEILLSLTSGGSFFIENRLYPIESGSLFLLSEATLHKSITPDSYRRYVLHISPQVLSELSTPQSDLIGFIGGEAGRSVVLSPDETGRLVTLFKDLDTPVEPVFCGDLTKVIRLLECLTTVFQLFAGAEKVAVAAGADFDRIAPIIRYIREHLEEQLTLDGLASRFFLSKYHMCHIFKAATGFSVMEYIIQCRILKARELLRQGMRVQEAGERVGFQNNAHFIRTFGALTGSSPKQYAKKYLGGDPVVIHGADR